MIAFASGQYMQELRQDIFPVCSFGRAENVFYQSSDSLCPKDLPLADILSLIAGHSEPLFPSHILDREDWETAVIEIIATGAKPRVQVALGREWEEISSQVLFAVHLGWGLDILVDRSLTMLVTPPELAEIQDWRWIACPLRFFNLQDMRHSLNTHKAQKPILWCFLEPRDAQTLLLNPDEVILAKQAMGDLPLLVLKSSLNSASGFYQNPTLEMYQSHFVELGAHKKTRSLVAGKLKNFPQLFSLFLFLGSFFLSESPRPLMEKLAPFPLWKLGKIKWMLYALLSRTRWALGQCGWFLRSVAIRVFWKSVAVARFVKSLLIKLYWFMYPVPGFVKMIATKWGWRLRHLGTVVYWKLYPVAGYLKYALLILGWPVLKIYWFCKFQYEKRIYPVVKGMLYDD